MAEDQTIDDLKFQGQGLQEAITLTSKYEELLQALMDRPDDKDLQMKFESMSPRTADLQTRFSPHLSTLGLLAAQLNAVQAKLEQDYRPTGGDLSAVSNTLANLESEFRVVSNKLEDMDRWVSTERGDLLLEIEALATSLDNLRKIFSFSNELAAKSTDGDIFRQTVISLLTAAIEELKAPAVNVGRMQGIGRTLKRVLKKSVEKKFGEAVDSALDEAVNQAEKVTDLARDLPVIDNLF